MTNLLERDDLLESQEERETTRESIYLREEWEAELFMRERGRYRGSWSWVVGVRALDCWCWQWGKWHGALYHGMCNMIAQSREHKGRRKNEVSNC